MLPEETTGSASSLKCPKCKGNFNFGVLKVPGDGYRIEIWCEHGCLISSCARLSVSQPSGEKADNFRYQTWEEATAALPEVRKRELAQLAVELAALGYGQPQAQLP